MPRNVTWLLGLLALGCEPASAPDASAEPAAPSRQQLEPHPAEERSNDPEISWWATDRDGDTAVAAWADDTLRRHDLHSGEGLPLELGGSRPATFGDISDSGNTIAVFRPYTGEGKGMAELYVFAADREPHSFSVGGSFDVTVTDDRVFLSRWRRGIWMADLDGGNESEIEDDAVWSVSASGEFAARFGPRYGTSEQWSIDRSWEPAVIMRLPSQSKLFETRIAMLCSFGPGSELIVCIEDARIPGDEPDANPAEYVVRKVPSGDVVHRLPALAGGIDRELELSGDGRLVRDGTRLIDLETGDQLWLEGDILSPLEGGRVVVREGSRIMVRDIADAARRKLDRSSR